MNKTLSIIILTHRSDTRFLRALASAQFADEVVVIDLDSQNHWTVLKKHFSFVRKVWKQEIDFAKIRNWAITETTGDWIFFLDSDEWISEDLRKELLEQIIQDENDAIIVQRLDNFLGKALQFGEVADIRFLRGAKKGSGKWKGKVHETWQVKGKVTHLDTPLLHEPHTSISEFIQKINHYSSLRSTEVENKNTILQFLFYPIGKFLVNYFVKFGILDGYRGLIYALLMTIHSASVRAKTYEQHH